MWRPTRCVLFLLCGLGFDVGISMSPGPSTRMESVYHWSKIDFDFPVDIRAQMMQHYTPRNVLISGIRVFGDRIFLATPRFREGVPSTLNWVPLPNSTHYDQAPLLHPFPTWEMQQLGNCSALQLVQGFEIDTLGRMWILDAGRVNIFSSNPVNDCPPKLVIYDLISERLVKKFEFPDSIAPHTSSFLNDLVLNSHYSGRYAYITDSLSGAIIVYSLQDDRSWKVKHESMQPERGGNVFQILGKRYEVTLGVDGIALLPLMYGSRVLFFTSFSGYGLYSIPTHILRNEDLATGDVGQYVQYAGRKLSQSNSLAMDSFGRMYYGVVGNNAISQWNTSEPFSRQQQMLQDDERLQWVDTFSFDQNGFLWYTSNRAQKWLTDSLDLTERNFRVMRSCVGLRSYMFRDESFIQCPQEPAFTNGTVRNTTAVTEMAADNPDVATAEQKTTESPGDNGGNSVATSGLLLTFCALLQCLRKI